MRWTLALAAALAGARALAGPVGAEDPNAASPTGFPGAYAATVELSLEADPRYGSRLLDALDIHLRAVGVMTSPREVGDYLEQSAAGSDGVARLRGALGHEALDPVKAGALLLADALARPGQFRQVLEELESLKRGVGRHAAGLLRAARGSGDKTLLAALRAAGGRVREGKPAPYFDGGRLAAILDASATEGADGIVLDEPAAAADGEEDGPEARERSRGADLSRPARP